MVARRCERLPDTIVSMHMKKANTYDGFFEPEYRYLVLSCDKIIHTGKGLSSLIRRGKISSFHSFLTLEISVILLANNSIIMLRSSEVLPPRHSNHVATPMPIDSLSQRGGVASLWPHWPLNIVPDASTVCKVPADLPGSPDDNTTTKASCPIGIPFEFESDLFKGKALFRFRDLETSEDPISDAKYFQSRKRKSQIVIQGRFKKAISVSHVMTGRRFDKPLSLVPPPFVERIIQRFLKKRAPGAKVELTCTTPLVLAPYFASVQVMRADTPGSEPNIASVNGFSENVLNENGQSVSSEERKKIFSDPHCRYMLNPEDTVYTFETYDDSFDYATYTMDFRVFRFDMNRTLNGQPMHVMAESILEGKPLWLFEIWHERLLLN